MMIYLNLYDDLQNRIIISTFFDKETPSLYKTGSIVVPSALVAFLFLCLT
jgi:hypothetical protein